MKRLFLSISVLFLLPIDGAWPAELCPRSTDSAKQFLEYRQCKSWREMRLDPRVFDNNNVEESLKFSWQMAQELGSNPCQDSFEVHDLLRAGVELTYWTKYDSPSLLLLLQDRERRIREIISTDTVLPDFVAGSLPTGGLTADVSGVPGNRSTGKIIILDAGLMDLLWITAKIGAEVVQMGEDGAFEQATSNPLDLSEYIDQLRRLVASRAHVQRTYSTVLKDYIVFADPLRSYSCYNLPDTAYQIARALNLGLELFVMAHEISHLTEGHLDPETRRSTRSQEREFDADRIGFPLVYEALVRSGDGDLFHAIGGPTLFLMQQEMVCRAWHIMSGGSAASYPGYPNNLSHPPPKARLAELRRQVGASGHPDSERALGFSLTLELLSEGLWFDAEPYLGTQRQALGPDRSAGVLADCLYKG